jgi:hypothetical protein
VWQQNRVFCALHTLHLRERLVETESAISDASPIVVIACSLAGS